MAEPSGSTAVVTIACWMDLYAYGHMMDRAGFDPSCKEAKLPLSRLRAFQELLAKHSGPSFPTLGLNDGGVAYQDLLLGPNLRLFEFLERSWNLFREASAADQMSSGMGIRGVVAVGLRARGSKRGIEAQDQALSAIVNALSSNEIDAAEALLRAKRVRRVHDIVPPLQANFAFAKAYEAERDGRTGGFEGPRLFVDKKIFRNGVPPWITCGTSFEWKYHLTSLRSSFAPIVQLRQVDKDLASRGLCTGKELRVLLSKR